MSDQPVPHYGTYNNHCEQSARNEPHAAHTVAVSGVWLTCHGIASRADFAAAVQAPTKQRPGDQVLPSGGQECVQDLIIASMEESKRVGRERYGSVLMTFNGRKGIQDVFEEARDLHVYLTQVMREAEADRETLVEVVDKVLAQGTALQPVVTRALAESVVTAVMGWVVGNRQGGRFETQEDIYDLLDDAWPEHVGVNRPDGKSDVIEALAHRVGDFLDVPQPIQRQKQEQD